MATDYRQCPGVATFNTGNSVCVLDPGKVKAIILVMHGYKLPKTLTADALEAACHADRPGRIFPIKTIVEYAPSGGEAQTSATGYGPTKSQDTRPKTMYGRLKITMQASRLILWLQRIQRLMHILWTRTT